MVAYTVNTLKYRKKAKPNEISNNQLKIRSIPFTTAGSYSGIHNQILVYLQFRGWRLNSECKQPLIYILYTDKRQLSARSGGLRIFADNRMRR